MKRPTFELYFRLDFHRFSLKNSMEQMNPDAAYSCNPAENLEIQGKSMAVTGLANDQLCGENDGQHSKFNVDIRNIFSSIKRSV